MADSGVCEPPLHPSGLTRACGLLILQSRRPLVFAAVMIARGAMWNPSIFAGAAVALREYQLNKLLLYTGSGADRVQTLGGSTRQLLWDLSIVLRHSTLRATAESLSKILPVQGMPSMGWSLWLLNSSQLSRSRSRCTTWCDPTLGCAAGPQTTSKTLNTSPWKC